VPEADHGDEPRLRVVLADDDAFARRAIRNALQEAGFVVVADATNGREAVELALHYRPDLVLLDVVMPELDGIAAARRIRAEVPEIRIVMLSVKEDDEVALMGVRAGASGYLSKELDLVELPRILEGVAAGDAALTPRIAAALIDELRRAPRSGTGMRPVHSDLTQREWEVLDLLESGLDVGEIAERLVLSEETVRTHLKSTRRKLGVGSREELIAAAQRLRTPGGSEG
jgi:NarL family two-component system response regulator LiaR